MFLPAPNLYPDFNYFSSNVDDSIAFWNYMGFRVTEHTSDAETGRNWAAWMHRKGGLHDVAFTNGTGPRLHHLAFWVPTPLNIIDLLDLVAITGYVAIIERGPGYHSISNAFFLYILCPMGIAQKSTVRIIRPSILITNRSTGILRAHNTRLSGAPPGHAVGLNTAPHLRTSQRRTATSRPIDHRTLTPCCAAQITIHENALK